MCKTRTYERPMTKTEQSLREQVDENRLTRKFVKAGIVCELCLLKMWALYVGMN